MINQRKRLAREWAKDCQGEGKLPAYGIAAQAAADHILATTTEPTMADVEWDDEKHYLAGATSELTSNEVVMLGPRAGMIDCFRIETGKTISTTRNALTPNGKRYELREVGATVSPDENDAPAQGEYPRTLTTVEDYENAPDGTIVAVPGWNTLPLLKRDGVWHRDRLIFESGELVDDRTTEVLRWGWGD